MLEGSLNCVEQERGRNEKEKQRVIDPRTHPRCSFVNQPSYFIIVHCSCVYNDTLASSFMNEQKQCIVICRTIPKSTELDIVMIMQYIFMNSLLRLKEIEILFISLIACHPLKRMSRRLPKHHLYQKTLWVGSSIIKWSLLFYSHLLPTLSSEPSYPDCFSFCLNNANSYSFFVIQIILRKKCQWNACVSSSFVATFYTQHLTRHQKSTLRSCLLAKVSLSVCSRQSVSILKDITSSLTS